MMDTPDRTDRVDPQQLLRIWLSPSFPVGAYAYSHGLETAAVRGLVSTRVDLEAWLRALLAHGSVRNDLVLLAAAHTQALPLSEINALALALQASAERYLETSQQGGSFATAVLAAWPSARLASFRSTCPGEIAYPVAFGIAAADHAIPLADTLDAFALAFVQNLASAAIRLSIVGQTDGQRVTAALMPAIAQAARSAAAASLDDLGNAAFSSDLASLEHETIGTRLFRS